MKPVHRVCPVFLLLASGCSGTQHVLDTKSQDAEQIATLWWVMLTLALLVSLLVAVVLAVATTKAVRRRRGHVTSDVRGNWVVAAGGVALPLLVVFPLLIYNHRIGTAILGPSPDDAGAYTIEVIGHQYWWEIRYPAERIVTANELRIPAGRRVRIHLTAPDVIHSFWVPQLHGKIDMIPGRRNTIWLRANEPGVYRGQCAEYCGVAHAMMAFWVEALPEDAYAEWTANWHARAAATTALTPAARRGEALFLAIGCQQCHATRGRVLPHEVGVPGPDLTDLATRRTLAAGRLPNSPESLAAWVRDPQRLKPGNRMPPTSVSDAHMADLVAYLESLR